MRNKTTMRAVLQLQALTARLSLSPSNFVRRKSLWFDANRDNSQVRRIWPSTPVCMGRRSIKIAGRKGAQDAKKTKLYSRIGKEVVSAVKRGGPNVTSNSVLAAVLGKAKELDLPKDIVDRNIKRANEKGQEAYIEKAYKVGRGIFGETDRYGTEANCCRSKLHDDESSMIQRGTFFVVQVEGTSTWVVVTENKRGYISCGSVQVEGTSTWLLKENKGGYIPCGSLLVKVYGYGGVSMVVEVSTDKVHRSVTKIREVIRDYGGKMADSGSVTFKFKRVRLVNIKATNADKDQLLAIALDAGAEDVIEPPTYEDDTEEDTSERYYKIVGSSENFSFIPSKLPDNSSELLPNTLVVVDDEAMDLNKELMSKLLELDDVDAVYTDQK
ncbi:putative transcriptional regulatory protein [Glycine soja]